MNTESVIKSHKNTIYVYLLIVASLSLLVTLFFELSETMKILTSTPFVGSLIVLLYQLLRDDKQFIKELIKQDREHLFTVAATSHMSKMVFDKHVEFAEKYIAEVNQLVGRLFTEGLRETNEHYGRSLTLIRVEYRLWLSNEISVELEKFEIKVSDLYGKSMLIDNQRHEDSTSREKLIEESYDLLAEILEYRDTKKGQGYSLVISHLQDVLGISGKSGDIRTPIPESFGQHSDFLRTVIPESFGHFRRVDRNNI